MICRKETLNQRRERLDVDRDFALLFFIFDENKSWYLEQNIQTYYNSSRPLIRNEHFVESNKMHGGTFTTFTNFTFLPLLLPYS